MSTRPPGTNRSRTRSATAAKTVAVLLLTAAVIASPVATGLAAGAAGGGAVHRIDVAAAGTSAAGGDAATLTAAGDGVLADHEPIGFSSSGLDGVDVTNPTALQFGPDGRLYVAVQSGLIHVYDVARTGEDSYEVTDHETITAVQDLPNHDDDGSPNPSVTDRLVTGILVTGTAETPVVYVTSSDPRIGGGSDGTDTDLDTNSGVLSKLTWDGSQWQHTQLVRGLPRNEENHASNGMAINESTNTLYIAQGGHTNKGAPSNNFAFQSEYALSAAILSVDLDAIDSPPYDLPTLQGTDDPFGGQEGSNMAVLEADGPVDVYSPGYRNPYDVLITQSGEMYTIDNGPNSGWGGPPVGEGPDGTCENDVNEDESFSEGDQLHHVESKGDYGGHPNPVRGNPDATSFSGAVPAANPVECDYQPIGEDDSLATFPTSTNGMAEYTASNFHGAMQGDLLAAMFTSSGPIWRLELSDDGTSASKSELFSNFGGQPIDVAAQGDDEAFPGTVWAATYGSNDVTVFEPNDYDGTVADGCTGADDASIDEDGDGYDNADELDAGTDPCSAASKPADHDGDGTSDVTDPDDDDDGVPDTADPFAVDADDGLSTSLPVDYGFEPGSEQGTLLDLGFTGLMTNGEDDYLSLYDEDTLTAGGAANVLTLDEATEGDAYEDENSQEQAFQVGVAPGAEPFTVHTTLQAPFPDSMTPEDAQSQGVYVGTGDQDNYVKLVANANGGDGGLELAVEEGGNFDQAEQVDDSAVKGDGTTIDLYLHVDPATGEVTAEYSIDGGPRQPAGETTAPTSWFDGGDQGTAVGVISTSFGPADPFPATWSQLEVTENAGPTSSAEVDLGVMEENGDVDASTFENGSFVLENTGSTTVESVTIDLSTATMPDMVFDPDGTAGDVVAKPFQVDSNSGAGTVAHEMQQPHDGDADDGYDVLELSFGHFDPDDSVTFSIDVDPTSIKGDDAPGPNEAGSVSGLELTGATLTATDENGTVVATRTFGDGSAGGSTAVAKDGSPAAPTIDVVGVSEGSTTLSAEHSAATTGTADHTVEISGPAGASVRMLRIHAGWFTDGLPGGPHDAEDYEANSALGVERTGLIDLGSDGTASVDVTLEESGTNEDLNYLVAVVEDGAGDTGTTSNTIVLEYDPSANDPPSADFTYSPSNPGAGETVTFDGSPSSDGDGSVASYAWDFDGDGATDATGSTATHAFGTEGTHDVTLSVTDDDGANGSTTKTVGVSGSDVTFAVNAGGEAYTTADGVTYSADTAFSGGEIYATSDPIAGTEDDPLYQTERYGGETAPAFSYDIPVENGDYRVTLQFAEVFFQDDSQRAFNVSLEGSQAVTNLDVHQQAGHDAAYDVNRTVTVSDGTLDVEFDAVVENAKVGAILVTAVNGTDGGPNAAPTASFTYDPSSPDTTQEVGFDGSASSDADGTVQAYEWDFGDDGTVDATGANAAHTFGTAGDHDVALTVTDDDGASDTAVQTVTVDEADPNATQAPTAAFSVEPKDPEVGETVTFDGTGSTDPDGNVTGYAWDLDGDGTVDANESTATHAYSTAGDYEVTLTVTDDENASDTATTTLTVGQPAAPPSDDGDDDSGGGGGGGGGGSAGPSGPSVSTSSVGANQIEVRVEDANRLRTATIRLPSMEGDAGAGSDLTTVRVTPGTSRNFDLLVERFGSPPGDAPALEDGPGQAGLAYFAIDHELTDADVATARLTVRVSKSRLDAWGADPSSVTLYRLEDGAWTAYETRSAGEDAGYHYFTASFPGLSRFAVGADRTVTPTPTETATETATPAGTPTPTTTETTTTEAAGTAEEAGFPALPVALVVLAVLAIVGVLLYRRRNAGGGGTL